MRGILRLFLAAAAVFAVLMLSSCAAGKERGILSAETALLGSRVYHAARISDTFQYIDLDKVSSDQQTAEPAIPCYTQGCTHDDDSCPAYIRGLTSWVAQSGKGGDMLWYAQMRSYIDPETHKGTRHNVISRLDVSSGLTATLLQDWQYVLEQLMLYKGDIYFLSKNAEGLRDIWVMPQSGGIPKLYIKNDGKDMLMLGMEDGVMFVLSEDGGVFRADSGGGTVTVKRIITSEAATGIFVYGGYIYYPVKKSDAPEYEYLPGRSETDASGEQMEVAVAVNSHDYRRIPAEGGESEFVVSGVQATTGSLCADGFLYLPAWSFSYYGSSESQGQYTDYFSRTSGNIASVSLDGEPGAGTLITGSELDFTAIYAVTDRYIIAKASDPQAAYANGTDIKLRYVLYNRSDGSVRTVDFK
jgi:hypothetical protein